MSQRERKPKDEPGRALPNLPKFLQGKPKAPAEPAPSPAPPASPPKAPASPAPAPSGAAENPPKPTPGQPQKPATSAAKPSGAKTPSPKRDVPSAPPPSPPTKVAPAAAVQPKPVPKTPSKTPPRAQELPAEQTKSQDKPAAPTPSAKRSEPARPAAPTPAGTSSAPVSSPQAPPPPIATVAAQSAPENASPLPHAPEAKAEPSEDRPGPPHISVNDATEPREERNGKNGLAVDDDVLPQAVSFTILREAMAAEKQFRPILFAGPLKRVAKAPAHAALAPAASATTMVEDRVSSPTLPEAKIAPEPTPLESPVDVAIPSPVPAEAPHVAAIVAREQREASIDAAPQARPNSSPLPSDAAVEAHEDETSDGDASHESETSAKERDRREAKRRKQVSSILAAAASRAKAATASETGESETHSPFADPWDHLRMAAAAAPHAAGPTIRTESNEDEEAITPEKIVRRTPPFAVSLVLHIVVFLLLALLALPALEISSPVVLDMNYATQDSDLMETLELDLPSEVAVEESDPFSTELTQMVDPLAGAPELPAEFGSFQLLTPSNVAQASVGFSGRDEGMKQALLGAFGGTVATQDAVKLGLGWMKRQQQPDGRWLLSGPYSNGCSLDNPAAATSMALLAFLGEGHTPEEGEFRQTMTKGVDALLRFQDSDGNFYVGPEGQHRLYTQAQATIAVCELYGMTGDERYREAAMLGLEYCLRAQAPEGGWRYYPGQESDTSVTGWFVMALKSAEMANLEVPQEAFDRISAYLDRVQDQEGWRYKYRIIERDYSKTMTAEGILCRQYLGWDRDDLRMRQGVDYLLESPISLDEREVYYWYYASQTMHHYGGPEWDDWNANLREVLPAIQEKKGREQGSWSPKDDEWGSVGGRLFMTSLCLYTLEIYYRHLPLYQQAEQGSTVSTEKP